MEVVASKAAHTAVKVIDLNFIVMLFLCSLGSRENAHVVKG